MILLLSPAPPLSGQSQLSTRRPRCVVIVVRVSAGQTVGGRDDKKPYRRGTFTRARHFYDGRRFRLVSITLPPLAIMQRRDRENSDDGLPGSADVIPSEPDGVVRRGPARLFRVYLTVLVVRRDSDNSENGP